MSLGTTIELGIMLGTIGSAYIIWRQLTALKNQIWISMYSDYTRRYAEIIAKFPENINEPSFDIKPGTPEFSGVMRAMRLYFDLCYEEHCLYYKYKKIDEELWLDWKEGIEYALSKKAFKNAWAIIHQDTKHSDSFDKFVQTTVDNHNPVEDKISMSDKENKKESWDKFWELIIAILGTYFAAYTIAKDYVEMVIINKQPPEVFHNLLIISIISWFIFMTLLIVLGFLCFKFLLPRLNRCLTPYLK